jgi:hypothetical protein
MRQTTINLVTTILTFFFVFNLAFGQTILEHGKAIKFLPATESKISVLIDGLTGTWQLLKTIRIENGDTIIQKPSIQLWLTPGAKPFTTIRIDSLRNFEIEQACMKCPYLYWKGQYEIEIKPLKGVGLFYLNFVDNRIKATKNKKRKEAFTLEFNGYLTNFENGELIITDKVGTAWIYKRM